MSKTKQTKQVEVRSDRPREVIATFLITGIEDGLLQNNWRKTMTTEQSPGPVVYPSPADEAETRTYRLPDQQLYILNKAFGASMTKSRGGAKGIKLGKNSACTQIGAGCSFSVQRECPLFDPENGKPIRSYKINVDRVKRGKGYIICHRPEIPKWACYMKVKIDERFITVQQFLDLLIRSGVVAGAGDNRPQRDGYYGKYKAELADLQVLRIFGQDEMQVEEEDAA